MKLNSGLLSVLFLVLCAPLLGTGDLLAADRYVSSSGSDANSGTLSSPFRTVRKGLENISAGNTLYLCAGACDGSGSAFFNEAVNSFSQTVPNGTDWIPGSGAIVVKNYSGETVTMAGVGLLNVRYHIWDGINVNASLASPLPARDSACVYMAGGHHLRYQNAEIQNCRWSGVNTSDYTEWGHHYEFINLNIHDAGKAGPFPEGPAHGIYLSGGNQQSGVGQASSIVIEGCDIHDNTSDSNSWGITIYTGALSTLGGITIRGNRVHDNSSGIGVHSGGDSALIVNNAIYNNTKLQGIQIQTSGNKVYNNTIYGNTAYYGVSISGGSSNVVKNNILFSNGGSIENHGNSTVCSNNMGASTACSAGNATDPQFLDQQSADFRLRASSPAINAGLVLSEVTVDILGAPRPSGSISMGAYEYPILGFVPAPAAPTSLRVVAAP